jgi:hypothetical protein
MWPGRRSVWEDLSPFSKAAPYIAPNITRRVTPKGNSVYFMFFFLPFSFLFFSFLFFSTRSIQLSLWIPFTMFQHFKEVPSMRKCQAQRTLTNPEEEEEKKNDVRN